METKDVVKYSQQRARVLWKGTEYCLCGYKVEHLQKETIKSVLLVDERQCKIWVRAREVKLIC